MKIISIEKIESFIVTTDNEHYYEYHRYNSDNWTLKMGESDETVYNCQILESLFQKELIKEKK